MIRNIIFTTFATILALQLTAISEQKTKTEELLAKGKLTMEMINLLTDDDVPPKWTTTKKLEKDQDLRKMHYKRGNNLVLTVTWNEPDRETMKRHFRASIYHNGKKVASVFRLKKNIFVKSESENVGYTVSTIINDNGETQVSVIGPKLWIETIVLDEKKTRLINDLDFMKNELHKKLILEPFMEDLTNEIEKGIKLKNKDKKTEK